eukprot:136336_1
MEQFGNHGKNIKLSTSNSNIALNDIINLEKNSGWSTTYGSIEINTNIYPKNVIFNWLFKYNYTANSTISIGLNSTNNELLDSYFWNLHRIRKTFYVWHVDTNYVEHPENAYTLVTALDKRVPYGSLLIKMSLDTSLKQLKFTANDIHFSIDNIDITQKYYLAVSISAWEGDSFQITDFFVSV